VTINFDQLIQREQTSSLKHDGRKGYFGKEDVIPLWVADMDFAAPEKVTQALVERAQHPIYGYTLYPDSLFAAMQYWFKQRHDWQIERKSIVMCPGVVPSLYAVIKALTEPGDKVVIQPPVYHPFFSTVAKSDRELLLNPLQLIDGKYQMDLAHFEQCAASGAKLLLLCSPHNPVGRVWSRKELTALLAIAAKYNVTIVSDEIHADLIFPNQQHTPLDSIASDVAIVTTISASKSFNIPGMGLSAMVVSDAKQRKAIKNVFENWHIHAANPFSITAFEAAYSHGENWLEQLMPYLEQTYQQVVALFEQQLPEITVLPCQGTYLLWLDCQAMKMSDEKLRHFFINDAKVGMNQGVSFGEVGSGYMRMNIAAPRQVIVEACQRIIAAYQQL